MAKYWYNTNYHTTIGMNPFQALYGIPPPLHLLYFPHDSNVETVDMKLRDRESIIHFLRHQLTKAQQCMKSQNDKHISS